MSNYNVLVQLQNKVSEISGHFQNSGSGDLDALKDEFSDLLEVVAVLISEVKEDSV